MPLKVVDGLELAEELYAQEGTPCSSCSCSYMSLRPGAGTSLGFDAGAGLTLRVCTKGRDPLVADGGTEQLWCEDYRPLAERIPVSAEDLQRLQDECSRGFVGDLAQGLRPLPRSLKDLRWYDRGFREGWLPPHRIEEERGRGGQRLRGPWEQFVVVGVTPAFGDGHAPAVGRPVLQATDRRSYLLPGDLDAPEAAGRAQPHTWWVNQVSAGAALPLAEPTPARRHHRPLVLRGGEQVLSDHAWAYLTPASIEERLDELAQQSLTTARAALRRRTPVVARLCVRQGLRARPEHRELKALLAELDGASASG